MRAYESSKLVFQLKAFYIYKADKMQRKNITK